MGASDWPVLPNQRHNTMSDKPNEMPEEIFANSHCSQRWGSYSLDDKLNGTSYTRSDLVQELRRDKERYEWLKANFHEFQHTEWGWIYRGDWIAGYGVEMNEAIDAAMNHERKEGE